MKLKRFLSAVAAAVLLLASTASADVTGTIADLNSRDTSPSVTAEELASLPSRLDLRDRGIVPPIRSQEPWGTCWGFGSIAASEITILSELNLTCEEFAEKYGYDLDLSERHLVWFATSHMPVVAEGDDTTGLSEEEITQAGEGMYNIVEQTDPNKAHFDLGGMALLSSSVFAAGFGPVLESTVPYTANDGTMSKESDWSVSEDTRFITTFDLLDSDILPNPAVLDDEGNYVYNEAATNAIKQELYNGHAVTICYHGDISSPDELQELLDTKVSAQEQDEQDFLTDTLISLGYTADDVKTVQDFILSGSADGMTDDEKYMVAAVCICALYEDEKDAQLENLRNGTVTPDEILNMVLEMMGKGTDGDGSSGQAERYISFDTYAQYTDDPYASVNHLVCVVGYDDDYAVENFLPEHQPPAPGAWIVRNSWGSKWGNGGYFYLSYYDMTITRPEAFTFDVSDFDNQTDNLVVLNYDFMQMTDPRALTGGQVTDEACIFTVYDDEVLTNAGLFTAVADTDVVLSVYLLNDGATVPDDGRLLDRQTISFDYAGYHRVKLTGNYVIPKGSRVSIVAAQTCTENGETVSVMPLNAGYDYESMLESSGGELTYEDSWYVASVNRGESYALANGQWYDWVEIIDMLKQTKEGYTGMVVDNPSLKLYLYPLSEIEQIHDLSGTETDADNNTVSVCGEDGYTVIR